MAVLIADLLPQAVTVEVGRGTVEVSGLTLDDIVPLFAKHKDELGQFFSDTDDFDAAGLLMAAPAMAAEIVALGIGAVGQEDDIRKMPAAAQIECLIAIWNQSVPDVKKLRESLLTVAASVSLSPENLSLSQPGTSAPSSKATSQSPSSTSSPKDTSSKK